MREENPVYNTEYLAKLGITANTDPNDPSTWSDELKKRHANTVSSLPEEVQKRIKIGPTVSADSDLKAEVVSNDWKDNIVKRYDDLVAQSESKYPGDGEDGRPEKIDPKKWSTLTPAQKEGVIEYVRARRFHDLLRLPENIDVYGASSYSSDPMPYIRPRVHLEAIFSPHNTKLKTEEQKAAHKAAHAKARDIIDPYADWGDNAWDYVKKFKKTQGFEEPEDDLSLIHI